MSTITYRDCCGTPANPELAMGHANGCFVAEAKAALVLMEASGDKVTLAYTVNGQTKSLEGTFTPAEARVSIDVAVSVGATAVSVGRFEPWGSLS